MTYQEAKELIKRGRNGRKKLRNNTYLHYSEIDKSFAIILHQTDVVRIYQDGTYELRSGGWNTLTTKKVINMFSPVKIYQKDFVWYLQDTNKVEFYNGIIVGSTILHKLVV